MQRHGSADGGVSHPADHLRDTPLGDAVQLTGSVRSLDPIVTLRGEKALDWRENIQLM